MLQLKSILPKLINVQNDPIKIKAFKAANEAMGELFTAGIIGHTCVRQQYLTAEMVQSLSKTCFSILLPMFLCTSIMKTVQSNGGKLTAKTIAIPFIVIFHCIVMNYISKYILLPFFQMESESDEGRSTVVCCAFGNSGVIPLIFAEALFRNNPMLVQKAYSFVSLYLVGWSPLFWSYGRHSLLGSATSNKKIKNDRSSDGSEQPMIIDSIIEHLTALRKLFPPPVIGVAFGLVASSIPFIQNLLMESKDDAKKPLLGIIYNSFQNLGRAANPLALLVLTSSLALGTSKTTTTTTQGNRDNEKKKLVNKNTGLLRRIFCVSVARFIISPILMTMILNQIFGNMKSRSGDGIDNSDIDTVMIWFILMLESCMPPAQNSVMMLQVAEKAKEATKLARFLFSIYATSMIPIVLVVTILLEKCRLT